nr:transferrin-binding protein-like solute binding protein [Deltaproteobacteria bacterium]
DPHSQYSEYVTWGYWEISYEDPESAAQYHLHLPGDFWIAGELTPASVIQDLAMNNIQGSYAGGAKGICINTLSEVSELTGGVSQIQVDFGTYQVSGNITFDQVNLELDSGIVYASSPQFSAGILGAGTSLVNGAFFGPNANAVGGNFDADMSGTRYMGIFGGSRVP